MYTIKYFRNDTGLQEHSITLDTLMDAQKVWHVLCKLVTVISPLPKFPDDPDAHYQD